jgi:hypothetical protein
LHFVEGLGSIENVQLFPMGNATGAESNGSLPISKDELPDLLSHAEPVSPDDELIEAWHYAPYYHAMFSYHGRNWTASLLLGGLGMITDDQGRTAAFKYKQRALKMSANSKEQ